MKFLSLFLVIFAISSAQAKTSTNTKVSIDTTVSQIRWAGEKFLPGEGHKGTVKVKSGYIIIEKKIVTGGEFIIDMTSIDSSDISGNLEKKLIGHLKSPDFFDVQAHPTASFKATKVTAKSKNAFTVTGSLTIRGVTHPETFTLQVTKAGKTMIASGKLTFDRKKYKVQYNSEADFMAKAISIPKDKVIKDTISLDLSLKTISM